MISRDYKSGTIHCLCGSQEFSIREWVRSDQTIKLTCLKCGEKSEMKIQNFITVEKHRENTEVELKSTMYK